MLIRSKQNSLVGLHGKTWWSCRDWNISRSQDSLPFLKSTGVPSNWGSCKSSNYLFPPEWNCTVSHRTTGRGGHCYIHSSGPRSSCLHKKMICNISTCKDLYSITVSVSEQGTGILGLLLTFPIFGSLLRWKLRAVIKHCACFYIP